MVRVTLAGVRSATHLVHAGGWLRHLLAHEDADVVVDYLGSGSFLGRDNVAEEHVREFLPDGPRVRLRPVGAPDHGRPVLGERRVLLSVGAPGIKPFLRLVARERTRPEVVVIDEGIGTYGDWRTRRDAWRRQGGREPWPTVRAAAVSTAARVLTDRRWALYERTGAAWRVVPEVAAAFTSVELPAEEPTAVYLTQPWVDMGLLGEDAYRRHLEDVAAACEAAGLAFAVRPHPAEAGGRYAAWRELPRTRPAELDPHVLAGAVVLGTDSTALLNLAAVHGKRALRVSLAELDHLESALGGDQRSLLDAFLPAPVPARDGAVLTSALASRR
ncbi:hypothetical protein ACOCJ5_16805 [Knoellia sp. CPCC 206450]|uniref:hypothetical protein n=1 Tax=Knoellia tibetensis TaxID=3404798 RepID=UPI003B4302D5